MTKNRIICFLLAVLMISSLMMPIGVFADEGDEDYLVVVSEGDNFDEDAFVDDSICIVDGDAENEDAGSEEDAGITVVSSDDAAEENDDAAAEPTDTEVPEAPVAEEPAAEEPAAEEEIPEEPADEEPAAEEPAAEEENLEIGDRSLDASSDETFWGTITITKQPQNTVVEANKTAKFSVEATGDDLSFLWQYKLVGGSWVNWTSKTTAAISVAYNAQRDGMSVRCKITDAAGATVTSKAAVLYYGTPLAITAQPQNTMVAVGKTAKFAVEANGEDLSFLWQYKLVGGSWVNWTSKTTAAISVAYNAERDGMSVRCKITDRFGISVTSKAAVLTYGTPLTITKQPQNATVAPNTSAKFSVEASGDDLSFLWQYKLVGGSWTNWTSKTTAAISVAYNAERNGMSLRVQITDKYGNTVTSDTVMLTYAAPITITKQPENTTVPANKTAKFSVEATGDDLSFLWQYKLVGGSWTNWTSKTTASISVAYNAERDGMSVRCKITDSHGATVTSKAAVLTYATPLAITKQPQSVTVEVNKSAKFSVEATGDDLSFLWQYKLVGGSWTNWTSKKTASISVAYSAERDGMSLRVKITDKYGTTVTSKAVTLTYKDSSIIVQDGVTYKKLADGTLTVFSYAGTASNLVIPTTVQDLQVTQISEDAFKDNDKLISISLPNNITVIGARAFKNCINLSSMTSHD